MKKIVITIAAIIGMMLPAPVSRAWFVGIGDSGGAEQTIKKGQAEGRIPLLAAPSNLSATPVSTTQIDLLWTDNSNEEQGFRIERKAVGGSYAEIATVPANITSYSDPGLTAGTTYYYRVKAYNASGISPYSNEASSKPLSLAPAAPLIPSGPDTGIPGESCAYSTSSSNPGYQVRYLWDWDGDGAADETSPFNISGWTDTRSHSWALGTYNIKVMAENSSGLLSGWSGIKTVLIDNPPDQPSAPTGPDSGPGLGTHNFSAFAADTDGDQVRYLWDWDGDGSADETSALGPSGWVDTRAHLWSTSGTFTIRVRAMDAYGAVSEWSGPKSFNNGGWTFDSKADIGSGTDIMYGGGLGDGRNDGVARVYGGCYDGHVYEFTYSGGAWGKEDIGSGSHIYSVSAGNGRNDGETRVYGAYGSGFYEFAWSGDSWSMADISGSHIYSVSIGSGRNDGVMRVYGGCDDGRVDEYTYSGAAWDKTDVDSGGLGIFTVFTGNGRNDGVMRVYGGCVNGHIYEFTYSGVIWNKLDIGSGSYMYSVYIGDGRNDGVMRVYAGCDDGHIYEFTYSGGVWDKADVGTGGSDMCSVFIGSGRNDGVMRVYGGCSDKHIYEFTYSGGAWEKVDAGSGGNTMRSVFIGSGRNDGAARVYSGCYDNHVYEFSYR